MSVRTTGADRAAGTVRMAAPVLAAGLAISGATPPAAATVAASAAGTATPVGCSGRTGDTAALLRALRMGGEIILSPGCTYTLRRPYGRDSALPTITRSTLLNGRNATIAYTGRTPIRTFLDVGDEPEGRAPEDPPRRPSGAVPYDDMPTYTAPGYTTPGGTLPLDPGTRGLFQNGGVVPRADLYPAAAGGATLRKGTTVFLNGAAGGHGHAADARRVAGPAATADRLRLIVRDVRFASYNVPLTRALTIRRDAKVSMVNTSLLSRRQADTTAPLGGGLELTGDGNQRCSVSSIDQSFDMEVRPALGPGVDSTIKARGSATLQATLSRDTVWGGGLGSTLPLSLGALSWTGWRDTGLRRVGWRRSGRPTGGLLDLGFDGTMATDARTCPQRISGREITVTPKTAPATGAAPAGCCDYTGGTI